MTTSKSTLIPINVTPGVQPVTDKSSFATQHYTFSDKIRFRFGYPQKIGGWVKVLLTPGTLITGKARTVFSSVLNNAIATIIGTSDALYSLYGSTLTNITPLQATTLAIPASLMTDYGTLAANPVTTVMGSPVVTISDTNAPKYKVGDTFTLSGATAFNGLTIGQLNTQHVIHSLGGSSYTTITGGNATGNGSGGGASVVRATGRLTVAATAHGQLNGQRVKITGAADTGGIVAATFINAEFILRNVVANAFDVFTGGTATSAVTGGGGAGTHYQVQIIAGAIDESFGQGYGMGYYGVDLYGTALQSNSALSYPRIWFIDRFGSKAIMTPGNQGGLYEWAGDNTMAPTLIPNAPTTINYSFVSDGIIVTFGAGGIPNRIFSCDQFDETDWTSSSSNQVFDYTEVRAGQFTSHLSVAGVNLIYTNFQTYLFAYLGYTSGVQNAIWSIQLLEGNIGLIGAMARTAVDGVGYWQGQHNFYMWAGGNVAVIPANSQEQSTILNYVFTNINRGQTAKCFAWYNEQFDEIWFHYPSAGQRECDRIARVNRAEGIWVPDTMARTAAEYPNQLLGYPRLMGNNNILYQHEQGTDDDGTALAFTLISNLQGRDFSRNAARVLTDDNAMLTGFVPDSLQVGNITVNIQGRRYPQSAQLMFNDNYSVAPDTEFRTTSGGARLWQYTITGNDLGQYWTAGQWHQYVQTGSKQ